MCGEAGRGLCRHARSQGRERSATRLPETSSEGQRTAAEVRKRRVGINLACLLTHSLTHDHSLRELGQELPEGDSVQEAVLMMLGRRVEVLKQRLQHMEKEHRDRLTAGEQTLPDCTAMLCRNVYSYNCGVANLPARCTKCKYIIIMLETLLCAQP